MHIGIIIGCLHYGGAERVATNLAKWLDGRGHKVSFFLTMQRKNKEYYLPSSIYVKSCYKKNAFGLIYEMHSQLKKSNLDVVLIMSTPICVYAIPALIGLNIPTVVSERSSPKNARVKPIVRKTSYFLMKRADRYVFQTNGAKACFANKIQKRGSVIPNPLVVEELPTPYEGLREKKVVAVGRLISEKNYQLLIKAFSLFHENHADYVLDIYGEGPQRNELETLIRDKNLADCVYLHGVKDNVLEIINPASIYVLSSDLEGMPNALIEAMALGIPCVSTDCPSGGPADLIKNGVNGFLVQINDAHEMVIALNKIADETDLSHKMSEEAVKIRSKLDINVIGAEWERVFMDAISTE